MKKPLFNLHLFCFSFLISLFFLTSDLQSQALSGYYTIGASPSNYSTISAAITDLKSKGVSGPTTMMIKQGQYNDLILLDSISGASSTNTITITTDTAATSKASIINNNVVCYMPNTKHIRITNLIMTTTASKNVVQIWGKTKDLKIIGNEFYGYKLLGSSVQRAVIYESGGSHSDGENILIQDNKLRYGSIGIFADGWAVLPTQKNLQIINNDIDSFAHRGIHIEYWDSVQVKNNRIHDSKWFNTNAAYFKYLSNFEVSQNIIQTGDSTIGLGLYFDWCNTRVGMKGLVSNNFIEVDGPQSRGVYSFVTDSIDYIFNTIRSEGTDSANCSAFRFYNGDGSRIINNNISALGGGYCLISNRTSQPYQSDNNNWYTTSKAFSNTISGLFPTFNAWRNAWSTDSNSLNENPNFSNSPRFLPQNFTISDTASNKTNVSYDIYGNPRGLKPDIGCVEFVSSINNASLVITDSIFCHGNDSLRVILENSGGNLISNLIIKWRLFNLRTQSTHSTGSYNYSDTLASGTAQNIVLSNLGLLKNDSLRFIAHIDSVNGVLDTEPDRDTVTVSRVTSSTTIASLNSLGLVCNNTPKILLNQGLPMGGLYFGAAVDSGFFIVDSAVLGQNTVSYEFIDQNQCSDTAIRQFIVHPTPVISANLIPEYCESDKQDTLDFMLPMGGMYSGSNINSGIFNPDNKAGQNAFKYVYMDTLGCTDSLSGNLEVFHDPKVVIMNAPVFCHSDGLKKLDVGQPHGGAYSGNYVVTDSLFNTNLAAKGIYSVKYNFVDTNGCMADTIFNVKVDSITPLTTQSSLTYCSSNLDTVLTFGYPVGGKYSGIKITSDSLFLLSQSLKGLYPVRYSFINSLGCSSSLDNAIEVYALPDVQIGNDTTICENDKLTITNKSKLSQYHWNDGSTTKQIDINQAGTYYLVGQDSNGCQSADTIVIQTKECINGVHYSEEFPSIKLFPNPTKGYLFIESDDLFIEHIQVVSMQGQLVYSQAQNKTSLVELNLTGAKPGLYFVHLTVGEKTITSTIILE